MSNHRWSINALIVLALHLVDGYRTQNPWGLVCSPTPPFLCAERRVFIPPFIPLLPI